MVRTPIAVLFLAALATAQLPSTATSPQMRFVDWHADLDRPGAVVVVGRLAKMKEGRRERLADGKLGGSGSVSAVSGTQYFKVAVTTAVQPRLVLFGGADAKEKLRLEFEIQLARLPDGSEQRQSRTADAAPLAEDTLALFVVAPSHDKKVKGLELLHVIPFDAKVDAGADGDLRFLDTMRDFQTVNQRLHDLERAIADLDAAKDEAATKAARTRLQELVDEKVELHVPADDALLTQHVGPLEQRARSRLAPADKRGG